MPTLLHLDSSADAQGSVSRSITAVFAREWSRLSERHAIVRRDLLTDPPPHLPDAAMHWAPPLRRVQDRPPAEALALQEALLAELLGADVLLIGAPLYNWSVPSSLKAWLDHIHVLGATASFGGSARPLEGRAAVIVSARGAAYGPGAPSEGLDFAVPMLEAILGRSLGMTVETILSELTLADRIDALAPMRPVREANIAAAEEAARQAARRLGGR
ncbi:MAG: NAD(P)H-dependent oxidoreductase [Frankiaceae bacterium]|nr:NAD(P)H-dependent oxidoreductase [Frankiaceae bacterium]